ncbi:AraC-type DNA-binding protein [Mucilaginibacter lappiensis]|uniref:AraC-like DNA-binding protein n=1 Tax=Mucilaginibacter lappiensis TaxID=354630 RepID=A0ABR6PHI7_9SPHI|nr:AraC family transcriptional regulator [Mucilaginibacter lappiensis]MBB6109212.1 AraC-like DNA-binding protein [Mucilaginibacter lappiensis]SIQ80297.1 AraC-type DNA-binding protein [Mucilaginibacter lappiensis]
MELPTLQHFDGLKHNKNWANEDFIPEHIFGYQIFGSTIIDDGKKVYEINEGTYFFSNRNSLAKGTKKFSPTEGYSSICICLSQKFLKTFSMTCLPADGPVPGKDMVIVFPETTLLTNYFQSLTPYINRSEEDFKDLIDAKLREATLILLKLHPEMRTRLFDFGNPGKIDLKSYMESNFRFNLSVERFSYLTGRSLSSFKKDFEEQFHDTPSKWLVRRRLKEAYMLIKRNVMRPSEVYLKVGFENLSHFSHAFKKVYGVSPSGIVERVSGP